MSETGSVVFLTVAETAELLRVSRRQVYVLAERGDLAHRRLGKRVLILKAAVDRFIDGDA